jgi:hypothetical protein
MTGRPIVDYDYRRRFDPARSPAWRYERVKLALKRQRPLHPKRDDELTKTLRNYYTAKERLGRQLDDTDDLEDELSARFKYVWCADRIFALGSHHRLRYELEASILARRTIEDIADRYALEQQTVNFYEKCFFNVTDKLAARSYIASTVLAPAFMAGLSAKSLEMTAKYFGYFGGPLVLDLVMDAFTDDIRSPQEPSEIGQWLDRQFKSRIRTSAMIGITYLDPSNYNIRTLLEGFQGLLSLSQRERSQTGDDNIINQAIQIFANQHRMPVGDAADKMDYRPGPMYGNGAVEPRIQELMVVASGERVPDLEVYNQESWEHPFEKVHNAQSNDRQNRSDASSGD